MQPEVVKNESNPQIDNSRSYDEKMLKELMTKPFDTIKSNLSRKKPTYEYELEFVRRVTLKEETPEYLKARDFFLSDFSVPILKSIAYRICHCDWRDIYSEYFFFISQKDEKTGTPYHKVALYRGFHQSTLKNYIATITGRFFINKKKKEDKNPPEVQILSSPSSLETKIKGEILIETVWFELISYKYSYEIGVEYDSELLELIRKKMELLPYREQLAIKLLVMDDMPSIEAFEELVPYFKLENPIEKYKRDIKQKLVATLKGRAIEHLTKLVKDEIKDYR